MVARVKGTTLLMEMIGMAKMAIPTVDNQEPIPEIRICYPKVEAGE
jgi:hypothetical protein